MCKYVNKPCLRVRAQPKGIKSQQLRAKFPHSNLYQYTSNSFHSPKHTPLIKNVLQVRSHCRHRVRGSCCCPSYPVSTLIAVSTVAVLTTYPRSNTSTNNQCRTDNQYCCDSLQKASSPAGIAALGSLAAILNPAADVGLTCSPLSVIGIAGNSW
jgi:hypothetical protein